MGIFSRESSATLPNQASNTTISATTTVNITRLNFGQTTAGITLSLANPANTALSRPLILQNNGSAIVHITGVAANSDTIPLASGDVREMAWNGSAWKAVGPLRSLVLNVATPNGILGGVTWTFGGLSGGNVTTLAASVAMTGFLNGLTIQASVATAFDFWFNGGTGGILMRGSTWNATAANTAKNTGGISLAPYSGMFRGYLVGNSRTFRITGGGNDIASSLCIIEWVG